MIIIRTISLETQLSKRSHIQPIRKYPSKQIPACTVNTELGGNGRQLNLWSGRLAHNGKDATLYHKEH